MPANAPRDAFPFRAVGVLLALALLFLGLAGALQRREYPHGTFLLQERHVCVSARNEGLRESVPAYRPGVTTLQEVRDALGEPEQVHHCTDWDSWVYTSLVEMRRERAWFGVVPHPFDDRYARVPGHVQVTVEVRVRDGSLVEGPPGGGIHVMTEEGWGFRSTWDPCPGPPPLPPEGTN